MKKILFMSFTTILIASFAISVAVSQNLNITPKPDLPIVSENDTFSLKLNSIKSSDVLRLNEVSSKAVRHFSKTYKNVDSVTWSRLTDGRGGFGAYFATDGIPTSVRYDQGGNYESSFREYFEDNLPREVRHRVKRIYYDYAIRFVREVHMFNNIVYLITLEDRAGWKNIIVTDNKIDVLIEFSKASKSSSGN